LIGLLLALYPAPWRRRYGEEFRSVLESRPLGPFDVADVVLGALDACLALRLAETSGANGGQVMLLRIGGFGAIAGGAMWAIGFVFASAETGDTTFWVLMLGAACAAILVALVGLSAFQAHRDPRLAWAAFLIPAAGSIASLVGLFGLFTQDSDLPMLLGWSPWGIAMLGVVAFMIGSVLFGVATLQAQVLSRRAATSLAWSSGAFLFLGLFGIGGTGPERGGQLLIGAVIVAVGASWAWLGVSALRRGPIREAVPA
jgi:hypothetical protein